MHVYSQLDENVLNQSGILDDWVDLGSEQQSVQISQPEGALTDPIDKSIHINTQNTHVDQAR
jgi:hypothetical protein